MLAVRNCDGWFVEALGQPGARVDAAGAVFEAPRSVGIEVFVLAVPAPRALAGHGTVRFQRKKGARGFGNARPPPPVRAALGGAMQRWEVELRHATWERNQPLGCKNIFFRVSAMANEKNSPKAAPPRILR